MQKDCEEKRQMLLLIPRNPKVVWMCLFPHLTLRFHFILIFEIAN